MIDCRECMRLVDALRAGTLPIDGRPEMEAHLAGCPACEKRFAAACREITLLTARGTKTSGR